MAIESTHTPNSAARGHGGPARAGGKAHAVSPDAGADAAPQGGFLSLLTSMDESLEDAPLVSTTAQDVAVQPVPDNLANLTNNAQATLAVSASDQAPSEVAVDTTQASNLRGGELPQNNVVNLAGPNQIVAGALPGTPLSSAQTSMVQSTIPSGVPAESVVQPLVADSGVLTARQAGFKAGGGNSGDPGNPMESDPTQRFGRKAGLRRADSGAQGHQAADSLAATSSQSAVARQDFQLRPIADLQRLLQREVFRVAAEQAPVAAGMQEAAGTSKTLYAGTAKDETGPASFAQTMAATDPGSSPAVTESQPVTSVEMQVAEQVQFWISNDVQNAQMQIEGLGEKPVEVSITMQGNEAHVSFRSDELLARGILESAATELRDMLGREGVMLAGMSVGTSAGNDAGRGQSGERQPRSGQTRKLTVEVTGNLADPVRVALPTGPAGRSLDLFV